MNWSLFRMHMFKRTIAYVEGNSCRDVDWSLYIFFLKGMLHSLQSHCPLFVLLFYFHSCLFWLYLCIYVSMYLCRTWESCWECTVAAFVAEATMFGFGKNKAWYLLQTWTFKMQKNGAHNTPPPICICVCVCICICKLPLQTSSP